MEVATLAMDRRGVTKAASRGRASDFAVDTPLLLNSPLPFNPPSPSLAHRGRAVNLLERAERFVTPRSSRRRCAVRIAQFHLAIIENATTRTINDHRLCFERDSWQR